MVSRQAGHSCKGLKPDARQKQKFIDASLQVARSVAPSMETGSPGSGSATPTSARASPRSQRPRETGGSPRGERNYNFLPTTTRPSSYLAYSRGKNFRRTFTLRTCTKERTGNATALHSTLDKHGRGDGRMTAARTAERTDHPTSRTAGIIPTLLPC